MTEPTHTRDLALLPAALAEYQAWLGTIKRRIVSVCLRISESEGAAVSIGQQSVDQLPWGHNILIFTKCSSVADNNKR